MALARLPPIQPLLPLDPYEIHRAPMAHDILIVDDEPDIRMLLSGILEDEGYSCRGAGGDVEALEAVAARQPSLVILDVWLEGSRRDGLELLAEMRRHHPKLPVLMISGHGTIETAVSALKQGAFDFIEKPFKTDRLLLLVERAIQHARLQKEVQELRLRAGTTPVLIGDSAATQQLRQTIKRIAPTGSRVLVQGPPGVGKELAARAIHAQSPRAEGPFIIVNCASDQLETVLFGREGPDGRAVGRLEEAHGGTLLLDEVADLPLSVQARLVRVLQDLRFERVGGSRVVSVDVRILSTTSRDLELAMEEGRFRRDLYYRLAVMPIEVRPLCERLEDVPLLFEQFMTQAAHNAGLTPRRLGSDAQAVLQTYDWPGNVRQLRNVVEWVLIMAPQAGEGEVTADELPPDLRQDRPDTLNGHFGDELMAMPLREAREAFERDYLRAQINRFGGNISKTSAFVGMERSALHRKLKSLGLQSGRMEEAAAQDRAEQTEQN